MVVSVKESASAEYKFIISVFLRLCWRVVEKKKIFFSYFVAFIFFSKRHKNAKCINVEPCGSRQQVIRSFTVSIRVCLAMVAFAAFMAK